MTEDQARAECARLAREHPDRRTHQFLPRHTDDGWTVVKVAIPPPLDQLGTEVRADERPEIAEDPRDAQHANVPGRLWCRSGPRPR